MKSAFGSKRKARKIQVDDDEDAQDKAAENENTTSNTPSNPVRKPFKKSSLRQSIAFDDLAQDGYEDDTVVNKPTIGRSSSMMKKKKKPASSRLSFGPGEIVSGDAAEALEDDETFTPKKATMERRVVEGNAFRKSIPYQGLPIRSNEDDEERPTYSKDYLNQLKSSTPTTPKDLQTRHATAEDEEMLDASELAGATIVDVTDFGASSAAYIPTEAEIKEKKERRARLAHEKDFISLSDDGDDRRQISLIPRRKEKGTRLVREDEDLLEGFDELVDDGRISLGKKAEREARKRRKKEMADMIHQAEGSSDGESDDSEAERRAAYETAQTRAGMDGLHKHDEDVDRNTVQIPSRITPLPVLSECLERLQSTMNSMEIELTKRKRQLEASKQEKLDIGKREAEVQELLKQAGARYAALKADTNGAVADQQSLLETGRAIPMMASRGLESFGNTPIARPDVEDVG